MVPEFPERVPKSSIRSCRGQICDLLQVTCRRRADTKGKHVIIGVVLAIAVLAAALNGVLVLMRVGMNRERERFLSNAAPTRIAAVARVISGLYVHMPERDVDAEDATARVGRPLHHSPTVAGKRPSETASRGKTSVN